MVEKQILRETKKKYKLYNPESRKKYQILYTDPSKDQGQQIDTAVRKQSATSTCPSKMPPDYITIGGAAGKPFKAGIENIE